MASPYNYQALPGKDHIRLLSLDLREDQVAGSLAVYDMKTCPEYVALSYAWGKPGSATTNLTCSGRDLQIQRNLYMSLQQFIRDGLNKPIWIDAICSNQEDITEKAHQVPLMRQIYAQASIVYAWLGEGSKDEMEVVSSMASVVEAFRRAESINTLQCQDVLSNDAGSVLAPPSPASNFWPALGRIINRPWFRRLWVLQEVLLAKEVRLYCGGATVDWATLVKMERIILGRKFASLLKGDEYEIEDIFKALNIVSNIEWCKAKMVNSTDNTVPISGLLHIARRKEVTDPLDRVYGMLGLVSQQVRNAVIVDYNSTPAKVYADLVQHCLKSDFGLGLLSQVDGAEAQQLAGLPSWCADFQRAAPINQFGGINGLASGFHAGFRGPFVEKCILSTHSNQDVLKLKGFLVDKVIGKIDGSPLPEPLKQNGAVLLQDWEDRCLHLAEQLLPFPKPDILRMFSRTLIANRCLTAQNLYQKAVGDSLESYHGHREYLNNLIETGANDSIKPVPNYPVVDARTDRAFIVTEKYRMGYARPSVEIGDVVCVFDNAIVPFILRPGSTARDHATLVGEAYVDGLMYAETLLLHSQGEAVLEDISIR